MSIPIFRKPLRIVRKVFIHCSASDNPDHDDVSVIRKWHTSPDPKDPSKPWRDVGYHYYIQFDGNIQKGRDIEVTPSAQRGHNTGTIAICLSGGQHGEGAFTKEQYASLAALCDQINKAIPGVTFHGHCEVEPGKTCPVMPYRKILNLDYKGRMQCE